MPRPRVSELSQRQAPRLRTSSSTSVSNHPNRLITTDRSFKPGVVDRRSPRSAGPHSDPLRQKKLGGRISDLESQLVQAQEELRLLKEQLANAEAVKKLAQDELHIKSKKPNPLARVEGSASDEAAETIDRDEIPGDAQKETDVFEVPVEKIAVEEVEPRSGDEEAEKLVAKEDEIKMLKARLYDMEKEHESLGKENDSLKSQLSDSASKMSNVKADEDDMASKVTRIGEELEESRAKTAHLKEKLESMEEEKDALEAEMKKLRVQTEQWRKAADAAAAVLSGSAEKCFAGGLFETTAAGFIEPPGMVDDSDDGSGSGKRKSSGMKMFGELWRKKGQK
ncbi:PREDICTED: interactor of constitutive active ROPs 1-like [Camelina sativa]|uniref:Interactor of constitutive active ROPs 1-like n=1 Tax=Camelina sativa TaxID=90675 RepID=A0ABM0YAB0_CAMSA|nr:PREDICTED: interactor of constitutive active ROPs 1-like [Camelina sativa]XP_010498056.1 PREDICTED: interactor of constitutive active ROPs 1-like [Camelina sativa]XP_019099045.1 PREDICTED: interactor of constitutive active ROPs 1-like [Camelina sativa]